MMQTNLSTNSKKKELKLKYELINPSDKIYYEAPDQIHSAVATALLSNGYGGKCLDDSAHDSPIFLFSDPSEWIKEKSGITAYQFIESNAQTLYDTLKSFRYASERTSMSRIVDSAHKYARAIDEKFLQQKPEEQAVS